MYLDWATTYPNYEPDIFDRTCGLCAATMEVDNSGDILDELLNLFEKDGLDTSFPFGASNYMQRREYSSQHLCELRLNWIKGKLNE